MGGTAKGFDQIKYQNDYSRKNYDKILLTMPKGKKDRVKARADELGKSTNGYINGLIDEDMRDIHD